MRISSSIAHSIVLSTSILAAVASHGAAKGTRGGSRLWPIPIRISLSSSFGEFREGHIHAGLDIRTLGRRGVPARAVEDGSIVRIRASSRGYGKALYLRLQSGETAVYAHLCEFAPDLEEYLYEKQLEAGRYEVDLYPQPGAFPVRAGEVIGYTGSTGTSAPHLHFEVRDVRGRPVNPLVRGWKVEDRVAPVIRAVVWIPLDRCSRVDGEAKEVLVELEQSGRNSFIAPDTLVLAGTCGLGAVIVDRTGADSGILAPYSIELSVDGRVTSRITKDRFSYEEAGEVDLEYEMGIVREEGRKFFLLFRRGGETLPGRTFVEGGRIAADSSLFPGEEGKVHIALIRATDRNGNTAVARVPFRLGCGSGSGRAAGSKTQKVSRPAGIFVFEDLMTVPVKSLTEDSRRVIEGLSHGSAGPACTCRSRRLALKASDIRAESMDVALELGGRRRRLRVFPVRPGAVTSSIDAGLGVELRAGASAFYADGILYLAGSEPPPGSGDSRELEPVSGVFRLGPSSAAFKEGIEIRIRGREGMDERAAVYRWEGKKKKAWVYRESTFSGDTLVCKIKAPGIFRAFVDMVSPRIGKPAVVRHRMYATGEVFPEVVFSLEDGGSGVDGKDTEVYLDGVKTIARWDYFSKKMFVLFREKNIIGDHDLVIIARDNSGNVSRSQTTISIDPNGKAASRGSGKNAQ